MVVGLLFEVKFAVRLCLQFLEDFFRSFCIGSIFRYVLLILSEFIIILNREYRVRRCFSGWNMLKEAKCYVAYFVAILNSYVLYPVIGRVSLLANNFISKTKS